ncbi:MAG: 2OG-Fe(II) oxygenase [Pseudomonas sp.]|uniref:2OG-Fe(II) oxygenase n=1 Tax=Pseudomonas sp. TaxID=306 RepID=UPI003BB57DCA
MSIQNQSQGPKYWLAKIKKRFIESARNLPIEPDNNTLIDFNRITRLLEEMHGEYAANQPFPHIIIDDFLPTKVINKLLAEYPLDNDKWIDSQANALDYQREKRHLKDFIAMPRVYRELIAELSCSRFLRALSTISGIPALIPDSDLMGAGIHQSSRGGHLKVHADFTSHRRFGLARRLNFLLYLNPDWQDNWGGHLELWDKEMQGPPVLVAPKLNRCVIFTTTADSFHGHPNPLQCPAQVNRKSLALYYYTNGRPEGEAEPTSATTWRDVPEVYRHQSGD